MVVSLLDLNNVGGQKARRFLWSGNRRLTRGCRACLCKDAPCSEEGLALPTGRLCCSWGRPGAVSSEGPPGPARACCLVHVPPALDEAAHCYPHLAEEVLELPGGSPAKVMQRVCATLIALPGWSRAWWALPSGTSIRLAGLVVHAAGSCVFVS